ncbi:MAG: hypothetical protein DA405_05615 [Bacteroidetes bacterium]|nr:MAG: hypothetical protein DA405_05615 [Bacteroidota bacterium]
MYSPHGLIPTDLLRGSVLGYFFYGIYCNQICQPKREKQNKVFKGIASKGRSTMGWFFGFKLHIIINERGEIIDFLITRGNVDDRKPLKDMSFHDKIIWEAFWRPRVSWKRPLQRSFLLMVFTSFQRLS